MSDEGRIITAVRCYMNNLRKAVLQKKKDSGSRSGIERCSHPCRIWSSVKLRSHDVWRNISSVRDRSVFFANKQSLTTYSGVSLLVFSAETAPQSDLDLYY